MDNIIHYGFGKDYLSNWGIKQALREIYQNFIDFGEYKELFHFTTDDIINVTISNNWNPQTLDFLRIGKSDKGNNKEAIGKHGEGMKMAFLIFERLGLHSKIFTEKYIIYPSFYIDKEIGECFCFKYEEHTLGNEVTNRFIIQFNCNKKDFEEFSIGILKKEDIIFTNIYHGSIINKEKGKIFVGGLYVCTLDNFKNSYNFLPSTIPLDRDREVPRVFDVNYHSSKILEDYKHWSAVDTNYDDCKYITDIPKEVIETIKPKLIGNSIEFITKDKNNNTIIIKNSSIKESLLNNSFFSTLIKKIKLSIIKHLGLYDLLIEFKDKYIQDNTEMAQDFEIILTKAK